MTPLRARFAGYKQALRCLVGQHENVTDAADGVLRDRCVHCQRTTQGWVQGVPGYHRTQEPDRKRLTLHNARLAECPCADCIKARRIARRKKRTVEPMRRRA